MTQGDGEHCSVLAPWQRDAATGEEHFRVYRKTSVLPVEPKLASASFTQPDPGYGTNDQLWILVQSCLLVFSQH